ncbi:MAG: 23S rRNA pseudouridine(955/2504/2580) synthase RluC [Gammaproteobacteria bacterium]|nr:23S rRNA pseudouridine(955/2504/2580) synthase RluC [Gammaproteobacteria bacterium]MBU1655265.1 23S rRNA pseudouridine(955/2504/2580) synthase RluC [Gammaproteobacteria bacterium]MBU1962044.1 23S rRNA pseudouridine(955/2504/2580) synthase RluC [Gammaproteobacteria bacterium]
MLDQTTDHSIPQIISATEAEEGQRLDNFLFTRLKGVPRSRIYRILRKGEVRVNKGRVAPSYRIAVGDAIRIPPIRLSVDSEPAPRPAAGLLERLGHCILFEDERLLVINKPTGLAVHGGSGLDYGLIEALRAMRPEQRELELVHRLDRETSGCLLVAKKRSALRVLHERMRAGAVEKRYLALLAGKWRRDKVNVDAPLRKNTLQGGERVVRVDPAGKAARTRFSVVERLGAYSLVNALLETGRTHQIRVHAAHLETPICGDTKYGNQNINAELRKKGLNRLFLHAAELRFRWPGENEDRLFTAPLDENLEAVLRRLRG